MIYSGFMLDWGDRDNRMTFLLCNLGFVLKKTTLQGVFKHLQEEALSMGTVVLLVIAKMHRWWVAGGHTKIKKLQVFAKVMEDTVFKVLKKLENFYHIGRCNLKGRATILLLIFLTKFMTTPS